MKILVYGAGPLGSLFATRLQEGGNDVSILARGQRLADLREHGIVLVDVMTKQQTVTRVNVVDALAPDDAYDLVLVIMRKNHALQILPILAANQHTPNVLFLMNNAAGPGELVEALGRERVLIGFPNSAGYREGHVVHCLAGTEDDPALVPFGEVDGRTTARTQQVARILESAPGFGAEIRTDMDAWLKYHVALLMPSLAPALYAAGTDNYRLARTRDLVVSTIRAMREGFRVLRALGLPVTPAKYRIIEWVPEPILVAILQRWLAHELMEVAMVKHAEAARDEVKHLANEFLALARATSVPTPTIDRLYPYLDPDTPLVPDGSAEIPLGWGGMLLGLGALAAAAVGGVMLGRQTTMDEHPTSTQRQNATGRVGEILRQGDLTAEEVKEELAKRDVCFVKSYDRAFSALFLALAVLWLLPAIARWSGWGFLSFFARLPRADFSIAVIVVAAVFFAAAVALEAWLVSLRQKRGGCNDPHETVVIVREGPYSVIRHPGYLAEMVYFSLLPVVLSRWVPLTVLAGISMVIAVASCAYLIGVEDGFNLRKWGDEYRRYMEDVPAVNFVKGLTALRAGAMSDRTHSLDL
jgi:ketopantoate reductase/protein-S-isoprenylcysteine O-methyltransferase Ste14